MAGSPIASVESIVVSLPRDVPYLGPLGAGETVNEKGYFVRAGNRTVYPATDMSVLVKATAADGTVGWGETYGIVVPQATAAIIDELFAPFVVGRHARDVGAIWQDLYDLQRVRGASGGYYGDALAGVDIALSDLAARQEGLSLAAWLAGGRMPAADRLPAYASGLPRASLAERVDLARTFVAQGFRGIKYAAPVARDGIVAEMRALREALGPEVDLMVDLHWKFAAGDALDLIRELEPHNPYFVEAPCAPEDIAGLATVAAGTTVPIAAGEEWRNVHEARERLDRTRLAFVQPEMGHTGPGQFLAIAGAALASGARITPHATIGVGIFLAASLHASATIDGLPYHEYQHSVFPQNLRYVTTTMRCEAGRFHLPQGPGLGVVPRPELWNHVRH